MTSTVTAPATVPRVGNPKRLIQPDDEDRITAALRARDAAVQSVADAEDEIRLAVLAAAANKASVRVLAEFIGKSTSTISEWKRNAR